MQEINLLVEQKDGSIETNFEEIKVALAAGLEEYKGDGVYRRIPAGSKKDGGKPA